MDFQILNNLGINRNVSHFNIVPGEWRMILNADVDKIGRYKKRKGYETFLNAPDANEILSLIPFNIGGANKFIMINAAGKLYSANTNAADWGSAILTGLSTTERWGYTVMADSGGTEYLLIGNGATVKKTSDGLTFSDVSGCPLAKYFCTLYQRVYAAGVSASPSTLFWSGTGDLTDWDTVTSDSGSTDIDVGSKGDIKGLFTANNNVAVYKERMMKRWNSDYMRTIRTSWGVEAPYSLAEIDGGVFSYDREAIRFYDGNVPVPISFYIQDLIEGMSNANSALQRRFGFTYRDKYYLNVGGSITDEDNKVINNAMIVYDYQKNMFVLYSFADLMTTGAKVIDHNGDEIIVCGDSNGQCYKMFTGDLDNDENVEMRLESHIYYPAGIDKYIEPIDLHVATENPNRMSVALSADFGDIEDQEEIKEDIGDIALNNLGQCRGFKLFISHATAGRPVFKGFNFNYELSKDER